MPVSASGSFCQNKLLYMRNEWQKLLWKVPECKLAALMTLPPSESFSSALSKTTTILWSLFFSPPLVQPTVKSLYFSPRALFFCLPPDLMHNWSKTSLNLHFAATGNFFTAANFCTRIASVADCCGLLLSLMRLHLRLRGGARGGGEAFLSVAGGGVGGGLKSIIIVERAQTKKAFLIPCETNNTWSRFKCPWVVCSVSICDTPS
jgi:hypothetical protein